MSRSVLVLAMVFGSGCSLFPTSNRTESDASRIELASFESTQDVRTVYVTSNGFHTGLVLAREDVPRSVWPEVDEIPDHPWVEVGWGSEIFYRAKKITAPVVLGAIVPNPSVLHVVGWDTLPEETFCGDLVRLEVPADKFEAVCRHIHESYVLNDSGHPEDLGPGIYGDGRFFRAGGQYYFPNTCNIWTARALQHGGIGIVPELCGVADAVLVATRKAGTTIRHR